MRTVAVHHLCFTTCYATNKQICPFAPKMTSKPYAGQWSTGRPPSPLQPQASLPPEQQLGVVLALQIFIYKVSQKLFEDIGSILQLALQHRHDQ